MSKYIGKNFVEIGRDRDCWFVITAARGKAGDPPFGISYLLSSAWLLLC